MGRKLLAQSIKLMRGIGRIMSMGQKTKYSERAASGKYCGLYGFLTGLQSMEWETSFSEVESIVGFDLPKSARLYQAWWANERSDRRHSQSIAWTAAGWETADVDMDAETLSFRRRKPSETALLDKIWPVHPTKVWPEGLVLSREYIYDDRA